MCELERLVAVEVVDDVAVGHDLHPYELVGAGPQRPPGDERMVRGRRAHRRQDLLLDGVPSGGVRDDGLVHHLEEDAFGVGSGEMGGQGPPEGDEPLDRRVVLRQGGFKVVVRVKVHDDGNVAREEPRNGGVQEREAFGMEGQTFGGVADGLRIERQADVREAHPGDEVEVAFGVVRREMLCAIVAARRLGEPVRQVDAARQARDARVADAFGRRCAVRLGRPPQAHTHDRQESDRPYPPHGHASTVKPARSKPSAVATAAAEQTGFSSSANAPPETIHSAASRAVSALKSLTYSGRGSFTS